MHFSLEEKKEIFLEFSDLRRIPSNYLLLNGIDAVLSESEINKSVFEFARFQSKFFSGEMVSSANLSISQPIPSAIDVLSLRVYDGSYNAHSLKWSKGKYVTLVNQGYLDLCKAISYSASKVLFREVQNNSNPAEDIARHLKEYLNNNGVAVSLPNVSVTDSTLFNAFSQTVQFFNEHMLFYILSHEYAHIFFGHCDHFQDIKSDIERKIRWEFLADHFAAYLLSDSILRQHPDLLFLAKPAMYLNFIVAQCIERNMNDNGILRISHPDISARVETASTMMNFVYDVTMPSIGVEVKVIDSLHENESKLMNDLSESLGPEGQVIDTIIKTL